MNTSGSGACYQDASGTAGVTLSQASADSIAAIPAPAKDRGFIVLSGPRSGSNLLRDCLNQHQSIRCFGEIFKTRPIQKKRWERLSAGGLPLTKELARLHQTDVVAFWKMLLEKYRVDRPIVGAKLFYEHRPGDPLWQYFASSRTPILHLVREDLIDSYLSLKLAKNSWAWKQEQGAERPVEYSRQVAINLRRFRKYCRLSRQAFNSGKELFKDNPYLRVTYAALANDRVKTMSAVYSFLGLPNRETSPRLTKQLSRPREEVVTNWDKVAAYIRENTELCVLR
jgi:LPS sulfotransferase NodH